MLIKLWVVQLVRYGGQFPLLGLGSALGLHPLRDMQHEVCREANVSLDVGHMVHGLLDRKSVV